MGKAGPGRYDARRLGAVAPMHQGARGSGVLTITMFGIKQCDTVRKARTWLDTHGVAHAFHDFKTAGIDAGHLMDWIDRAGLDAVLNRASTTFRKLPEADRVDLDTDKAVALMIAQPSTIKRPVLDTGATLLFGFKPERYEAAGLGNN